jgi:hypothetical protein
MSTVEKLIDKRLIDRNLRKGLINLEEYRASLDRLVDRSDNILNEGPEGCQEPENSETSPAAAVPEMQPANVTGSQQVTT